MASLSARAYAQKAAQEAQEPEKEQVRGKIAKFNYEKRRGETLKENEIELDEELKLIVMLCLFAEVDSHIYKIIEVWQRCKEMIC